VADPRFDQTAQGQSRQEKRTWRVRPHPGHKLAEGQAAQVALPIRSDNSVAYAIAFRGRSHDDKRRGHQQR